MLFENWSKFIILMGRRSSFWNKCIVTARFRFGFLISQTLSLLLEYNFLGWFISYPLYISFVSRPVLQTLTIPDYTGFGGRGIHWRGQGLSLVSLTFFINSQLFLVTIYFGLFFSLDFTTSNVMVASVSREDEWWMGDTSWGATI